MSYIPTIIISKEDLDRLSETTDDLQEPYEVTDEDDHLNWAANEIIKSYEDKDYHLKLKGTEFIIMNCDLSMRNEAIRDCLADWDVEYCLDN